MGPLTVAIANSPSPSSGGVAGVVVENYFTYCDSDRRCSRGFAASLVFCADRGAFTGAITTPLDVIKIRLMVQGSANKYKGIFDCAQTIAKEEGPSALWKECVVNEERQLLGKVAELLASSNARKKKLVQAVVHDLRESAASRTVKLQKEISTMQDSMFTIKTEWTAHMENTETCVFVQLSVWNK